MTMEEKEEFVRIWIQVPDEKFKQYFWTGKCAENAQIHINPTVDMSVDIVDWQEMIPYVDDALGCVPVCRHFL